MPETQHCPRCRGEGLYWDTVQWSDGLGQAKAICELCDGSGAIGDLAALALQYKRELAKARLEYRNLCVAVALHDATSKGELPDPPLQAAPRPSPYPSTWRPIIDEHLRKLPRESA